MTITRDKLYEAEYFLNRMIEKQSDRAAFKFNLSAFLAAFRSITLIMQKEYKHYQDFDDWYKPYKEDFVADNRMKLLNEKRVQTIHLKPLEPKAHVDVEIIDTITISDSVSIILKQANGTIERYESKPQPPKSPKEEKTTVKWRWYFEEMPDTDVITICQECISKLQAIVTECEQKFN